MHASIAPKLIEQAIQRYYIARPVQLSVDDVAKRTEAIEALAAVSEQAIIQVREAKTALIAKLKAQQVRLIRLHAEEGDDISPDAFREERARIQSEIKAAEQSLAETSQRLTIETHQLKLALELAEDVAEVYTQADEPTKRSLNQAFFKRLYILPEWDDEQGQKAVQVTGAELTEPYALLLSDGLAEGVMAEVEAILARAADEKRAPESQSAALEPFAAGCSYVDQMAERAGFEPAMEFNPHTRLAGECLQPLGHLS
jgi:hypothetical protein